MHSARLAWVAVWAVLVLLGSAPAGGNVWADGTKPAPFTDLTQLVRERIDRLAQTAPVRTNAEDNIDFQGDVTAWLISHTQLTAEEEREFATKAHDEIRGKHRLGKSPEAVDKVFGKLLAAMPERFKPFEYKLTVLEGPEINAFTVGGGYVYVTTALVDNLVQGKQRGEAALAFALAHELGHVAYGHCRRGYQLQMIQDGISADIKLKIKNDLLQRILTTGLEPAGSLVRFLYSREQVYQADLFALHLCRNAGFDLDECLDLPRWLVLLAYPEAATRNDFVLPEKFTPALLTYYLSSRPDPVLRLKALRMEWRGEVSDPKKYALFRYDPATATLIRAGDRSAADKPSLVFIHGMRGDEHSFDDFLAWIGKQESARDFQIFVVRYPSNGSLALAGKLLHNEMTRVFPSAEKAVFICHSAGGLVFRYYAERLKGQFDHAVLLATPNAGSDVTGLKFLVELRQFGADLSRVTWEPMNGPFAFLSGFLAEGRGQITFDIQPDSLFLRYLARDAQLASRYRIFCGRVMDGVAADLLRLAFLSTKAALQKTLPDRLESPFMKKQVTRQLERLKLPREITDGDGVVSVDSASLPGAASVEVLQGINHVTIVQERKVFEKVWPAIRKGK